MDDELRKLIERWKDQGYVTYSEFRKALPPEIMDEDQINDITDFVKDMGLEIRMEKAAVVDINLGIKDE